MNHKCICDRKREDTYDIKPYRVYKPYHFYEKADAIKEARDYGVSIDHWSDGYDQTVLDISHLGYPYKNCWIQGDWCWSEPYVKKAIKKMNGDKHKYIKAVRELISFGIELSKKVHTQVMFTNGSGKGYLVLKCFDLSHANDVDQYMKIIDGALYMYMVSVNVNCHPSELKKRSELI